MECGTPLKGRADKKYCDDTCRSTFNNKQNHGDFTVMKKVNGILRKNRGILQEYNPEGKKKIPKKLLLQCGFDFEHYTSTYTTKEGKTYYFCYEYGYLPLENDYFFLVVKMEKPQAFLNSA